MIRNLNQLSFQAYGSIESERIRGRDLAQKAEHRRIQELNRGEISVLCGQTEVWLCNHSNMTVLSVANEGEEFRHFYLDKVVCIKPGVRFAIHPYQERSSVEITATVSCDGRTGVEMEALTAVSAAALTVYDMCKAVQKDMVIADIRLLSKTGGVHGDYHREETL